MTSPQRFKEEALRDLLPEEGMLAYGGLPAQPLINHPEAYVRGRLLVVPSYQGNASAEGMLDAFLRIRRESDVAQFVRRYGTLGLCKHRLPGTHERASAMGCPVAFVRYTDEGYETLEDARQWLPWVRLARLMLEIAAATRSRDQGAVRARWRDYYRTWSELARRPMDEARADQAGSGLTMSKLALSSVINRWLSIGDVQIRLSTLDWEKPSESIEVTGGTFGLLGLQLMTACLRAQDLAICDGCLNTFLTGSIGPDGKRSRRPQTGRKSYCPDCRRDGRPERDRQRRYRESLEPSFHENGS